MLNEDKKDYIPAKPVKARLMLTNSNWASYYLLISDKYIIHLLIVIIKVLKIEDLTTKLLSAKGYWTLEAKHFICLVLDCKRDIIVSIKEEVTSRLSTSNFHLNFQALSIAMN